MPILRSIAGAATILLAALHASQAATARHPDSVSLIFNNEVSPAAPSLCTQVALPHSHQPGRVNLRPSCAPLMSCCCTVPAHLHTYTGQCVSVSELAQHAYMTVVDVCANLLCSTRRRRLPRAQCATRRPPALPAQEAHTRACTSTHDGDASRLLCVSRCTTLPALGWPRGHSFVVTTVDSNITTWNPRADNSPLAVMFTMSPWDDIITVTQSEVGRGRCAQVQYVRLFAERKPRPTNRALSGS
jgi:hypothetical protein